MQGTDPCQRSFLPEKHHGSSKLPAQLVRHAFNALIREFTAVSGISIPAPVIMPGITLFDRIERGPQEKVILVDLLSEGTWRTLKRKHLGIGSNLYAVWGRQLGKPLGLEPKSCLILGEFCHSWMSRKGSRLREFSGAVADCEKKFAEFVQNGKRILFDRSEKERYRQGWTKTLPAIELMKHHQVGCLPVVKKGKLVGLITTYDLLGIASKLLEKKLRDTKC